MSVQRHETMKVNGQQHRQMRESRERERDFYSGVGRS